MSARSSVGRIDVVPDGGAIGGDVVCDELSEERPAGSLGSKR